jgi:hypothetical protein
MERIFITDITLHSREYRQTTNFSRIAERGRMYSPVHKDYVKNINTQKNIMKISIELPPDLKERVMNGEVELMIPKDGLLVYGGKDFWEVAEKMQNKERKQLIHNSRTWHTDEKI